MTDKMNLTDDYETSLRSLGVFGGHWHLEADTLLGDELGADAGRQLGLEARGHAGEKGLKELQSFTLRRAPSCEIGHK